MHGKTVSSLTVFLIDDLHSHGLELVAKNIGLDIVALQSHLVSLEHQLLRLNDALDPGLVVTHDPDRLGCRPIYAVTCVLVKRCSCFANFRLLLTPCSTCFQRLLTV